MQTGQKITLKFPDPEKRLNAISQHLMTVISTSLPEIIVCFREVQSLTGHRYDEVMRLHAKYQDIWSQAIDDGVQQKVFRPVDKIAVKGLLGMYFYTCIWFKPGGSQTLEEIGEIFCDLVIRSLYINQELR